MESSSLSSPITPISQHVPERFQQKWKISDISALIVAIFLVLSTVFILPITWLMILTISLPIRFLNFAWWIKVREGMARCGNFQFLICSRLLGMKLKIYGDNLEKLKNARCLLTPNHLGLLDHFLFMMGGEHVGAQTVSKWVFVIYSIWKFLPLGFMWMIYGNYFVDTVKPDQRKQQLEHLRKYFEDNYYKYDFRWITIYPEGSRLFLLQKKNSEYEKRHKLPEMKHCAYPRIGATQSVLKALGPREKNREMANCGGGEPLKHLIDVTLGYPNARVTQIHEVFWEYWRNGVEIEFSMHYQCFEIDPKWTEESELKRFLFERFQSKDKILDDYYKTGNFPGLSKDFHYPSTISMISFEIFMFSVFLILLKIFYSITINLFS